MYRYMSVFHVANNQDRIELAGVRNLNCGVVKDFSRVFTHDSHERATGNRIMDTKC